MCRTRRGTRRGRSSECWCNRSMGPAAFIVGVLKGGCEAPEARSPVCSSAQEASTFPSHMVPELTLEAFSLRKAPVQEKSKEAVPNQREILQPLAPACHLPSLSPVRGQIGSNPRANSLVRGKRAERRICPQESCLHHLSDRRHN